MLAILSVAILGAVFTIIRGSAAHREMATAEVAARNYSDALASAPYVRCAKGTQANGDPGDYDDPPGLSLPAGFRVETIRSGGGSAVEYWVAGSDPADPQFTSTCDSADPDGETGLQRVWYQVVRDRNGASEVLRSDSTLKRYDGTIDNSFGEVPGGGVRCTITAAEDASLSESDPMQVDGTSDSMTVTGLSGNKFRSLVKFPISPGETPCAEGGTVPTDKQVRSAALRLYTWQVDGNVDCPTDCTHVLRRVTTPWSQSTVSWSTPLSTMPTGNEVFDHGTGSGDFGPRFQLVTGPGLTIDVATFYAVPSLNQGWAIDQACPPEFPGRGCATPDSAFRMRTSEWKVPGQRPQLSIVFGSSFSKAKQLRNVGVGTCASVFENDMGDAARVVSQTCAGKAWQGWNIDKNINNESTIVGLNNTRCVETGNNSESGSVTGMWGCHTGLWQLWKFDGPLIRYKPDLTKCLEVNNGDTKIGAAITIATCVPNALHQQWAIEPLIPAPPPGQPVRLRNVAGNNCVDVAIHQSMGGPVKQSWTQGFPCMGPDRTLQAFIPMPDGRMILVTDNSMCLDMPTTGINRVTVDDCHQGANQQWIQEAGGRLRNLKNGTCLVGGPDIAWMKTATCDDSHPENQQWLIEPATSPSLADVGRFQNVESGACLEPISPPYSGGQQMEAPCDSTRPNQEFIRLNNGEIRPLAKIDLCVQVNGGDANQVVNFWTCDVIDQYNNPTNTHQQWDLVGSGQLINRKKSVCAQGFGPGIRVQSKTCDTALLSQRWNFGDVATEPMARQIRNVNRGSCLDGVNQSGNGAGMWPCSGAARPQQAISVFVMSDNAGVLTAELRKVDNVNKCLDQQDNAGDGARSEWKDCTGSEYQRWVITPTATAGQVRIASFKQQGRCLTAAADESLVVLRACDDNNVDKRWVIESPEDLRQIRQIRNLRTGACVDVRGTVASGAVLTDFPCLGSARPAQAFMRLNTGSFVSMADEGLCLDRNGGGEVNKEMLLWTCNRTDSQRFTATGDQTTAGQFKNASGRCQELRPAANNIQAQNCVTSGATFDYQQWFIEPVEVKGSPPVQFRYADIGDCIDVTQGFDGNAAQVLPCLGGSRLDQQFVFTGSGLVRLRTDPTKCLDSAGTTVGKALISYACDGSNDNQKWEIDGSGRLANKRANGLCVERGVEGNRFTMQPCSPSLWQKVTVDDAGASPKTNVIGHLRIDQTSTCADSDEVVGPSNQPHIWALPCFGSARAQQIVVMLTNGQIRSFSDLTRCLDANTGDEGQWLYFTGCVMPASYDAQLFDVDANGWRTRKVQGGIRRCVTSLDGSEGTRPTQTTCTAGMAGQKWLFEPVAM